MNTNVCEKVEKCPIYLGILKSNEMLTRTYKNLFCENGVEGKNKCVRYQVAKVMGSCPPNILPNTKVSVEEIVEKMKREGIKPNIKPGNNCSI